MNQQIIANGHGWVYKKYCTADYCNDWLKLEERARENHIGLWEDSNPQPPWEWQAEHREKESRANVPSVAYSFVATGGGSSIVYHGNIRSHAFHGPSCRDYNCKNCVVNLGSIQEAVRAGYHPYRACVSE